MSESKTLGPVTRKKYEDLFSAKIDPILDKLAEQLRVERTALVEQAVQDLLPDELFSQIQDALATLENSVKKAHKILKITDLSYSEAHLTSLILPSEYRGCSIERVTLDSILKALRKESTTERYSYENHGYEFTLIKDSPLEEAVIAGRAGELQRLHDELSQFKATQVEKIWFADAPGVVNDMYKELTTFLENFEKEA